MILLALPLERGSERVGDQSLHRVFACLLRLVQVERLDVGDAVEDVLEACTSKIRDN